MNSRFDAIVVGGGPAGAAAGHVLAASGMSVAIVDRAVFPRDKLCGGALSERSEAIFKSIFGAAWDAAIETVANGIAFYHNNQFLNRVDNYRPIYFTSRRNFDNCLLELAARRGATVLQGVPVSSIDRRLSTVSLANDRVLRADFIIGADGVNSRIAKVLGLNAGDSPDLALGLELEVPRDEMKRQPSAPEIYFGVVRWGYGWVFPGRTSFNVGVVGLLNKNPDLQVRFDSFLCNVCGVIPRLKWKGHHIPFGSFRRRPGLGNILLAGDAAGLVEPVTGEGIAFAMLSGKCAAEGIIEAAASGNPGDACKFYRLRYEKITRLMSQAKIMRRLIFPEMTQRLFTKVLSRSRGAIRQYMDLLAGDIGYADYAKYLLRKVASRALDELGITGL